MPVAAQNDIIIRPLTSSDVPEIRALHSMILPVQYPPAFFTQLLILPSRACLVAVRASQPKSPVAFISAALHKSTVFALGASKAFTSPRPRLEILTLGVLPSYQHFGLARRLIRAIINKLNGHLNAGVILYAHVATTNAPALKFYENIGMSISSEIIPNLYRTCPHGQRDAYLVSGRWTDR